MNPDYADYDVMDLSFSIQQAYYNGDVKTAIEMAIELLWRVENTSV